MTWSELIIAVFENCYARGRIQPTFYRITETLIFK